MSISDQIVEQLNYKVKEIPLGSVLDDKRISIGAKIVYILNVPISTSMKLNKKANDSFSANTVQIIKAPKDQVIEYLFISTSETSSTPMSIFLSDEEIFSDIGIEDRAVLVDSDGIEYDARLSKSNAVLVANQPITTVQTYTITPIDMSDYDKGAFLLYNFSDVAVSVQFEALLQGSTYVPIGSPIVLVALTGMDIASITDALTFVRVKITNTVLGTSGNCTIYGNLK